ncbi:hypothetical protein Trydic_g19454 [Trypoxylus dichotomus]
MDLFNVFTRQKSRIKKLEEENRELGNLRYENSLLKYSRDTFSKQKEMIAKNSINLRKENAELKVAHEKVVGENASLLEKLVQLESEVDRLKSYDQENSEKTKMLDLQNRNLQKENADLKEKLAKIEANLSKLDGQYKENVQKLTVLEYDLSYYEKNDSFSDIAEIENSLQLLVTRINKTIEELTTERMDCEVTLHKYLIDYENSKEKLLKSNVHLSQQNFPKLAENYKQTLRANDHRQKEVFKMLYEVGKELKSKSESVHANISEISNEVREFIAVQNEILDSLDQSTLRSLRSQESELYQNALKVAKREMALFDKLQDFVGAQDFDVDISISLQPNGNNQNEVEDEKSVVIENFEESENNGGDLFKVKCLLAHLNLERNDEVAVERLGLKNGRDDHRPLKVTFQNGDAAKQLLEIPCEKTWLFGSGMSVSKFKNN